MTEVDQAEAATLPKDPPRNVLREVVRRQRLAFVAEGMPSVDVRLERIDRFVAAVLDHAEEIADALDEDFGGRPRLANLANDVLAGVSGVGAVRERLADWMADRPVQGSAESGTPTVIQVRPKGVVGVIGPWNFPVSLVVQPTIEALAAGNRVVIKCSDIPVRTGEVFARAVASRMDPSEVTVVQGGVETARAFSDLAFDHILFTGSPPVGALVAEAAGRNLVPVTLELGGKNPVVISSQADLAQAADRIAGFKLSNGGQICLSPDYVFAPNDLVENFLDEYSRAVHRYFPTYVDHPGVVAIINDRNFDRVIGLIDDATDKGARTVVILKPGERALLPDRATRRIAPTVLMNVTTDMAVASEEIFGPVIVIHGYSNLSEAIDYINERPSPLAAYWFGPDDLEYREFLARTHSGGVTRNDIGLHWVVDGAPSGGVGRSGMGAYSGETGFATFSHFRTVTVSELPNGVMHQALPPAGAAEAQALSGLIGQMLAEVEARIDNHSKSQ